jgi:uncharacterized protein (TIGR00375 family)
MEIIADFHIHSKYSRATSQQMNLETLDKWARIKGIKVLGTGDFTHPEWFKSLKENLEPAEPGLYKLKASSQQTRFILTAEISCIYSKPQASFSERRGRDEAIASASKNRVRKIHILIFAPSFEVVEKINTQLSWVGNLRADGRPILGLDAKELAKIALDISEDCLIVPAHAYTPWFGIFGSKSGFDSIEECFEEYSKYIYAVETGLSADSKMFWRISSLDKIALISNSDAHSPAKIGREANVFETGLDYKSIIEAIKTKDPQKFLYTIEFYPEEGKYHYDGHRLCQISLPPWESKKSGNICPRCGKPLTVGVLSRTEELADRPVFDKNLKNKPKGAIPFKSLLPLSEIIAAAFGVRSVAKRVEKEYENIIKKFGNEFNILLNVSKEELESVLLPEIAEGIIRVREGNLHIEPGYDGIYGKLIIFNQEKEKRAASCQKTLF